MRRYILLCSCIFFSLGSASAQGSTIRTSSLLLTQEKFGWRVSFSDSVASKYSLCSGDLLTTIDSRRTNKMGPLAVMAAFNAAFVRSVPIIARRGAQQVRINLWRGDGSAPAPKKDMRNTFVSGSNQAPDFTLPTLRNVQTKLSAQRGRWVLLSFLNRLAQTYPQKLTVLALAVSDSRDKLGAFAAKMHPVYTILDAGLLKGQPALAYGVGSPSGGGSVPVNVLIRPDGTIAYVQGGYEAPSPLEKQVSDIINTKR